MIFGMISLALEWPPIIGVTLIFATVVTMVLAIKDAYIELQAIIESKEKDEEE